MSETNGANGKLYPGDPLEITYRGGRRTLAAKVLAGKHERRFLGKLREIAELEKDQPGSDEHYEKIEEALTIACGGNRPDDHFGDDDGMTLREMSEAMQEVVKAQGIGEEDAKKSDSPPSSEPD